MIKRLIFSAMIALGVATSVNAQITIEAESFSMTSGTYGGFETYELASASGGSAINWNQTGDYAMYQLQGYQSGQYVVTYHISTPMDGAAVEFSVMSPSYEEAVVTAVPNNGSWDDFQEVVSAPINIISGNVYTVIIKSVGNTSGDWEWNLDKVELTRVGDLNFPLESIYTLSDNPVTIDKGEILYLEVGTLPTIATNQNLTWVSSNPTVVTVPSSGTVITNGGGPTPIIPVGKVENYITGLSEGVATITVTSEEGAYVAEFNVTVVDVYGFTIQAEDAVGMVGGMGMPVSSPTGTAVEVTNNKTGLFTFQKTINTNTFNLLNGKSGEYKVEYLVKTESENTTLTLDVVQYDTYGPFPDFTTALPNTNGEYQWVEVSDYVGIEYARNSDMFQIIAEGTEAIVCYLDAIRFTKVGPLNEAAEGLSVYSEPDLVLSTGQWVMGATVAFTPLYTTNQTVTWTSSNPSVLAVNEEGYIYTYGGGPSPVTQSGQVKNDFEAVSAGTATVTAVSEDGNFEAVFNVTVFDPHDVVIEAEDVNNPFTLGMPISYEGGTAVNIKGGISKPVSLFNNNPYASVSLFAGHSGEYLTKYLVKTETEGVVLTIDLYQSSDFETLPSYTCELPNTNGQYVWVEGPYINFEYGRNASSMGFSTSGSSEEVVCQLDKIKFEKVGPLNTPAEGLTAGSDTSFNLGVDQWEMAVKVEFTPHFTANQNVTWVSSNPAIVEVEPVGSIYTYGGGPSPTVQSGIVENHFHAITEGTATVTATSEDGGYSVSFEVTVGNPMVSEPVIFEAEDFSYTAGTYDGFQIYQVSGASNGGAINWNQTGDWATYELPAGIASGVNEVEYFIGTPMNGAQIGFAVDYGDLEMVDNVVNNGSWDSFVSLKAAETIEIDGSFNGSVQVKSVGAEGAWQWNLDYFTLTKVAELPEAKSGKVNADVDSDDDFKVYPVYVTSDFTVDFELDADGAVTIDIVNISGVVVAQVVNGDIFFEGSNSVSYNAGSLSDGIYFVRLITNNKVQVEQIVK